MRTVPLLVLVATLGGSAEAVAKPALVRAAPAAGTATWSPRRLFNAGLAAEERHDPQAAIELYLAARLSARSAFADELYAKGAGLRLVRVLSRFDEDAATAVALHVADEARGQGTTDLAPLIRTLVRRVMGKRRTDLELVRGRIDAIRYREADGAAVVDIGLPSGAKRVVAAHGPVGPFSAGDNVRVLIRRERHGSWAEWRLISMSYKKQDGWKLIAVEGLPSGSTAVVHTRR